MVQRHVVRMRQYFVYILANRSRRLYIGVTNDMARRLAEHRTATTGFSARYRCCRLVLIETTADARSAIAREKQLKNWPRCRFLDFALRAPLGMTDGRAPLGMTALDHYHPWVTFRVTRCQELVFAVWPLWFPYRPSIPSFTATRSKRAVRSTTRGSAPAGAHVNWSRTITGVSRASVHRSTMRASASTTQYSATFASM